jgi:hypothetical protein
VSGVAGLHFWADLGGNLTVNISQSGKVFYNATATVHNVYVASAGVFPVGIVVVVPAGQCQTGCQPAQFSATPYPRASDWPLPGVANSCAAPLGIYYPTPKAGSTGKTVALLISAVLLGQLWPL